MIIALVKDLFFQVMISDTAKMNNIKLEILDDINKVDHVDLLIIDLEDFGTDGIDKIKIKNPGVKIIGYLSHIQFELKTKAKEAGFDLVLPKSEFSKKLLDILTDNYQ